MRRRLEAADFAQGVDAAREAYVDDLKAGANVPKKNPRTHCSIAAGVHHVALNPESDHQSRNFCTLLCTTALSVSAIVSSVTTLRIESASSRCETPRRR